MKTVRRIHEWLANHVSFIQYPDIRPADLRTRNASRTGVRFVTKMPIWKRFSLIGTAIFTLPIGLAGIAVAGFVFWILLFKPG